MDENAHTKSRWAIDSGLLLLLITSFAYAAAFAFEAGYLGFFGAPLELAEVNLKGLLLCAAGGSGLLFFMAGFSEQILLYMPQSLSPRVQRMLTAWLMMLSFLALCLWAQDAPWRAWLLVPLAMVLSGAFIFIPPLWGRSKSTTYSQRFEADLRADKDVGKTLGASLARQFGRGPVLAVFVAVLGTLLANSVGVYVARRQETFLLASGFACAVLRVRAEGMLCVSLDEKAREVTPRFRMLPTERTEIKVSKVGRVHVLEPATAIQSAGATATKS